MKKCLLKRGKMTAAVIGLLVVVLSMTGASLDIVRVIDQTGRVVEIPQPVDRIVSIYGLSTYFVYALGAGDRLVKAWYAQIRGITHAPEALHRIEPYLDEKLSFGIPNVEEIVVKAPDLVLANPRKHGNIVDILEELGIPSIHFVPEGLAELKEAMRITGAALGPETAARAEKFVAFAERIVGEVESLVEAIPEDQRVRVYFCGRNPLLVASGDMFQSMMVEIAGGISVTRDLRGFWNVVNLEQVLVWQPDVIIISTLGGLEPEEIMNDPDWSAIPAVRNGRVYKMPGLAAPWDVPVPDSILGIIWLAETLYPEAVDLDLEGEIRAFYEKFYELQLTDEEVAQLLNR